jgi:hypothetical protein
MNGKHMLAFLSGLLKGPVAQQEDARLAEVKPPELEKSATFTAFVKARDTQKFLSTWQKKNYTKRGVTKLLLTLWPLYNSDKKIRQAAQDILSSLIGEDGLSKVLSALKLVPEGIRKLVG